MTWAVKVEELSRGVAVLDSARLPRNYSWLTGTLVRDNIVNFTL